MKGHRESNSAITKRVGTLFNQDAPQSGTTTPYIHSSKLNELNELRSKLDNLKASVDESLSAKNTIPNIEEKFKSFSTSSLAPMKNMSVEVDNLKKALSELLDVNNAMKAAKDEVENVKNMVKGLGDRFESLQYSKEIDSLRKDLEAAKIKKPPIIQKINGKNYEPEIEDLKSRIVSLSNALSDNKLALSSNERALGALLTKHEERKHIAGKYVNIGPEFNLPELPQVIEKAGIYQEAPVSLSVNGGIVLHNIGYKDKRDPNKHDLLCVDRFTGKCFVAKA